MLTETQARDIKKQIISQIESTFPEDKKSFAVKRIEEMNPNELEEFLVKNKLVSQNQTKSLPDSEQSCVFCSIVSGQIDSHKIDENKSAITVLEINPISRGHVLIIPKEHASIKENSENDIKELIKQISILLKKKLKPKKIITAKSVLFGHETISIIPVYSNETANSQRRQATPGELDELKEILEKTAKKTSIKAPQKKIKISKKQQEKMWLPRRIP